MKAFKIGMSILYEDGQQYTMDIGVVDDDKSLNGFQSQMNSLKVAQDAILALETVLFCACIGVILPRAFMGGKE